MTQPIRYSLQVREPINQDCTYVTLHKYEQDEKGDWHCFLGSVSWDQEYQGFDMLDMSRSLVATGRQTIELHTTHEMKHDTGPVRKVRLR